MDETERILREDEAAEKMRRAVEAITGLEGAPLPFDVCLSLGTVLKRLDAALGRAGRKEGPMNKKSNEEFLREVLAVAYAVIRAGGGENWPSISVDLMPMPEEPRGSVLVQGPTPGAIAIVEALSGGSCRRWSDRAAAFIEGKTKAGGIKVSTNWSEPRAEPIEITDADRVAAAALVAEASAT